jgi:hypothetical protein
LPQATVNLPKPGAPAKASTPGSIKITPGTITNVPAPAAEEKPIFAIAACVAAVISLGVQLWVFFTS